MLFAVSRVICLTNWEGFRFSVTNWWSKWRCTCNGKHNASEWDPTIHFVVLEEEVDVVGVEGFEHGRVPFGDVVHSDQGNADEPDANAWGKRVAHFVRSKSLETKQQEQNGNRNPYHHVCKIHRFQFWSALIQACENMD